ncbi:MAG: PASTA domain-containing protein [Gemmatimonadaceae bacterium]|nr:PASTA domain-containing protein [Gemmatimonadaceae bacterium]
MANPATFENPANQACGFVPSGRSRMTAVRRVAIPAILGILALPAIGEGQPTPVRPSPRPLPRPVITRDSPTPAKQPQVPPGRDDVGGTSDGPRVIPNVIGMTTRAAIDALTFTELRIVQRDSSTSSMTAGLVVNQRPLAGTPVNATKAVTLFVATEARKPKPDNPCSVRNVFIGVIEGIINKNKPSARQPTDSRGCPIYVPPDPPKEPVVVPETVIQDRTLVPDLRGNSPPMVTAALRRNRLALGRVARDYSDDADSGRVFRQEPPAGTEVVTLTDVHVWYSVGLPPPAPTFRVPRVVGLALAEAADSLRRAGFRAGRVQYLTRRDAEGRVVQQSPREGDAARRSDAVDLTITTPPSPVTVPSVIDLTREAARRRLESNGLGVGRFTRVVRPGADGVIVSQRPAPRTTVDSGSLVDLVENRAPEVRRVRVPDLAGKSVAAADSALRRDSLVLGEVLRPAVDAVDRVIVQRPEPGQTVLMHSAVTVALGAESPQPAPTTRVPGVVSLTLDSARRILANSGFTQLSLGGGGDAFTSASIVESQAPPAGTFAAPNTLVSLVAGAPPRLPPMPNLIGQRRQVADVVAELDSLRMIVTSEVRKLRLRDEVVSQDPEHQRPRRPDSTVDVVVEIPFIPPVAAAMLGLVVVAGVGGATVLKWHTRGPTPPPSAVVLKPVTREPAPPVLHAEERDTLIRAAFALHFGRDAGPWNLELPSSSIVKSEEWPDA